MAFEALVTFRNLQTFTKSNKERIFEIIKGYVTYYPGLRSPEQRFLNMFRNSLSVSFLKKMLGLI